MELIDFVDPKKLDVGESTIVEEPDKVDYCVTSSITTAVTIFSEGQECAVNLVRRGLLRQADGAIQSERVKSAKYLLDIGIH